MKYKLQELFKKHNVTGISFNSKKIRQGDAFFALKGVNFDGNDYIGDVFNAGANLVFSDSESFKNKENSLIIYVEDIRQILSYAVSIFYPKIPDNLIAVTGTNGKTSIVAYCQQLFKLFEQDAASIGTIGVNCSDRRINSHFEGEQYQSLTTADILTFREILDYLADNNINYVAFEASSHGIEQGRLSNIFVQAAAFASFSLDHLDYHKTMDNYLNAKLKLFSDNLLPNSLAVINSEIAEINYIKQFLNKNNINYLTVGVEGDLTVDVLEQSISGQKISFDYLGKNYTFNTEIVGSFQASNLLIATMLVNKFGFSLAEIIQKLPQVKAVRGRLERVTDLNNHYQIFVDYAHTPDALEKSLNELKKVKKESGKLIVVFGCGGDRDKSKRPLMGNIAKKLADIIIVTDDNPRFENPFEIRKQILTEAPQALEVSDRREAILLAINMSNDNDILLIAGKGHENYQIINDLKIPFDDIEITKEILRNKK